MENIRYFEPEEYCRCNSLFFASLYPSYPHSLHKYTLCLLVCCNVYEVLSSYIKYGETSMAFIYETTNFNVVLYEALFVSGTEGKNVKIITKNGVEDRTKLEPFESDDKYNLKNGV